jgi:hypothetical protein
VDLRLPRTLCHRDCARAEDDRPNPTLIVWLTPDEMQGFQATLGEWGPDLFDQVTEALREVLHDEDVDARVRGPQLRGHRDGDAHASMAAAGTANATSQCRIVSGAHSLKTRSEGHNLVSLHSAARALVPPTSRRVRPQSARATCDLKG